jgi:hypothetical protein
MATVPSASPPAAFDIGMAVLFGGLLVAVAAHWLFLPLLPHQDFPGHVAMLAIRERLGSSAFLQRYLASGSILGPYSGFLGLGHALAPAMGAEGAVRVIGALASCALPCALLLAHRRLCGRRWWGAGFLGLVITLGHLSAQGLISFLLGLAVMVLAFTGWVQIIQDDADRWPRARRRLRLSAMVALALLTALTHGFAFLLLLLAAGVALAVGCRSRWRAGLGRVWVFLPAVLALLLVQLRDGGQYPAALAEGPIALRSLGGKLLLPFLTTFLSRLGLDAVVAAVLWLLLGAVALQTIRAARLMPPGTPPAPALLLTRSGAVLAGLALLAPYRIHFFSSFDLRVACTALLVAMLAVVPAAHSPRLRRALHVGPPLLAGTMVLTLWVAGLLFQREATSIDPLLRKIPEHTRLLYLPVNPDSRVWAAAPFWHLEKRVLFDRDLLVANVWLHQGSALFPTAIGAPLLSVTPLATADGEVRWSRYDLGPWDHVLVRNGRATGPLGKPSALELVASAGGMHLYRNRGRLTGGRARVSAEAGGDSLPGHLRP